MAYDEELANRVRELLAGQETLTEMTMFGGLAFLIAGNMAVSASGRGGLLLRVDAAKTAEYLAVPHVERMSMGGRSMDGWITVGPEGLSGDALAEWVDRGVAFARTLPAKMSSGPARGRPSATR